MSANARGQALLDRIAARVGLTEEGKLGLLQLINPIMDFDKRKVGFAGNADESLSVVQVIKRSFSVTAPPLGGATTWDLNFFNTPVNTTHTMLHGTNLGNFIGTDAAAIAGAMGPFVCLTAPSGTALTLNNAVRNPAVVSISGAICPDTQDVVTASQIRDSYNGGTSCVIAMGFEYHDTTAQLYKQGTATIWRQPQPPILDKTYVEIGGVTASEAVPSTSYIKGGAGSAHFLNDVPGSLTDIMLLGGTRQWEAKDGAYIVPTLIDSTIPMTTLEPCIPVIQSGIWTDKIFPGSIPVAAQNVVYSQLYNFAFNEQIGEVTDEAALYPVLTNTSSAPFAKFNNFNSSGVFVTGLAPQASVTLNTVTYIERVPRSVDTLLVPMATRSPGFDPLMMELYSQIMQNMPIGCKVADNADGDWFFEGLSTLANFLSKPVAALGGFGIPIGAGLAAVSSWSDGKLKERQKQVNKKKAPVKQAAKKKQQPQKRKAKGMSPQEIALAKKILSSNSLQSLKL